MMYDACRAGECTKPFCCDPNGREACIECGEREATEEGNLCEACHEAKEDDAYWTAVKAEK
jgi:hypothetical protein